MIRNTAEKCEEAYISSLKEKINIQFPSELKVRPDIRAPQKRTPRVLRSVTRSLKDNLEMQLRSTTILQEVNDVIVDGQISPNTLSSSNPLSHPESQNSFTRDSKNKTIPCHNNEHQPNLKESEEGCIPKPKGKITPSIFKLTLNLSDSEYENLQVSNRLTSLIFRRSFGEYISTSY